MISLFRGLRSILILAAAGVLFGAFLMFWEAILMLVETFRMTRLNADMSVIVSVLRATDKILLGIVLMVVGCGIALGFALDIHRGRRGHRTRGAQGGDDWRRRDRQCGAGNGNGKRMA